MKKIATFVLFLSLLFLACTTDQLPSDKEVIPQENETEFSYYDVDLGPYFGNSKFLLDSASSEQAALGRILFYDTKMSANDLISCASCHQQHQSFADGKRTSPGFEGELTHRNSISLINVGFQPSIFWDTSGEGLENDVLRPIINPIEMGFDDVNDLVNKLAEIPDYRDRFENVFGDPEINEERIGSALAQFVGALISYQSKFDAGLINGFINFSDAENKGMDLFFEDALCSRCHNAPFFAGDRNVAVNIGLDLEYEDKGNGNGKFKVPSLRNIALSGPYMHDGRFQSLSEVIQHYSTDIQNHLHLSSQLKDPMNGNKAVQLNLNQDEKDALIAFLNTLTDWHFVNDERFSNPF